VEEEAGAAAVGAQGPAVRPKDWRIRVSQTGERQGPSAQGPAGQGPIEPSPVPPALWEGPRVLAPSGLPFSGPWPRGENAPATSAPDRGRSAPPCRGPTAAPPFDRCRIGCSP